MVDSFQLYLITISFPLLARRPVNLAVSLMMPSQQLIFGPLSYLWFVSFWRFLRNHVRSTSLHSFSSRDQHLSLIAALRIRLEKTGLLSWEVSRVQGIMRPPGCCHIVKGYILHYIFLNWRSRIFFNLHACAIAYACACAIENKKSRN